MRRNGNLDDNAEKAVDYCVPADILDDRRFENLARLIGRRSDNLHAALDACLYGYFLGVHDQRQRSK